MDCLKGTTLMPLIKELDEMIDTDILKTYKPVSNLVFLSKLIERVVAIRMEVHMDRFQFLLKTSMDIKRITPKRCSKCKGSK